jgi:hypothetical protein
MASRRLEEREPISPELVLVSPPDVARRAREELREPAFFRGRTAAVRDRPPKSPRGVVAEPLPHVDADPPRARSKRRRGLLALAATAVGVAAVAYFVAARDTGRRADDASVVGAAARTSSPRTSRSVTPAEQASTTATGAAHPQRRHTAKASRPAQRGQTARAKRRGAAKQAKPPSAVAQASSFVPARTWTWPKSNRARGYELQFRLDGRLVLQMRTRQPHVVLPRSFRFRAGLYRWVVQRIPAAAKRRPIVDSTFVLTRATAARANR